jgi:hypothetical protein
MMTLTYQDLVQTQLPWQEKTVHNSFLSTGTLPCWDSQVLVLPHLPPVTKHRSPSTASSTYKCSIIITGCGRIQDENLQVIFWHQARNELAYQHAFLSFNFILHYLQGKSNITYFYFYYIYQRWYNDHHCYFIVVRLLRWVPTFHPILKWTTLLCPKSVMWICCLSELCMNIAAAENCRFYWSNKGFERQN